MYALIKTNIFYSMQISVPQIKSGLGIRSSVFRSNRSYLVIERSLRSWSMRANRSHRSLKKIRDRRSTGAIRSFVINRGKNIRKVCFFLDRIDRCDRKIEFPTLNKVNSDSKFSWKKWKTRFQSVNSPKRDSKWEDNRTRSREIAIIIIIIICERLMCWLSGQNKRLSFSLSTRTELWRPRGRFRQVTSLPVSPPETGSWTR